VGIGIWTARRRAADACINRHFAIQSHLEDNFFAVPPGTARQSITGRLRERSMDPAAILARGSVDTTRHAAVTLDVSKLAGIGEDDEPLQKIGDHYCAGLNQLGMTKTYGSSSAEFCRALWTSPRSDLVVLIDVWLDDPRPLPGSNAGRPWANVRILFVDSQQPDVW
jgi:hypothetical protein